MPYNGIKAEAARKRLADAILKAKGQEFTSGQPLDRARVTSGFGDRIHPVTGEHKMHRGVDFAADDGTPVYATADGVITQNKNKSSGFIGGNSVFIDHPGGQQTRYEHLDRFSPQAMHGGVVKKGDLLGWSGHSGRVTGPHLHYGLFAGGVPTDPLAPMDPDHPLFASR